MSKQKLKFIILTIAIILGIIILNSSVFASNEGIQILENSSNEYLIYVKGHENATFKSFALSNDKDVEPTSYIPTEKDSEGKTVAYVNDTTLALFDNTTYMWAKLEDGTYALEAVEIDLSSAVKSTDLETAASITKIIEADTTKTSTTEKEEDGKKITLTVGEVVLKDEEGSYSYIIVKLPNSEKYNNLMKLATKISKFNSETEMYTQIETYSEFLKLFNELKEGLDGWVDVNGNTILQPAEAEDGEEYVLWIKDNESDDIDVQFLTSTKQYSEEKIKETITTKLPVTYDNNTLLIVFAILIVLIVAVAIRIEVLNKKEN